jgi:hypothetical protein
MYTLSVSLTFIGNNYFSVTEINYETSTGTKKCVHTVQFKPEQICIEEFLHIIIRLKALIKGK